MLHLLVCRGVYIQIENAMQSLHMWKGAQGFSWIAILCTQAQVQNRQEGSMQSRRAQFLTSHLPWTLSLFWAAWSRRPLLQGPLRSARLPPQKLFSRSAPFFLMTYDRQHSHNPEIDTADRDTMGDTILVHVFS